MPLAALPPSPNPDTLAELCPLVLARARQHSAQWHRTTTVRTRLKHVRTLRHLIVENAPLLLQALGRDRDSESLSAEIIPLADACKFLEKSAHKILKPRPVGRTGRPLWLRGVTGTVYRDPFGAVLILGPSNYPLIIPGVQAIQAIVAGNAVVLKPGPGSADVAELLADLIRKAGFPSGLIQIVPETTEVAAALTAAGFDKIILTGSAPTGKKVLASCAESLTPATLELSGCDPVFLTPTADVERAAAAIAFALTMNQGHTCIAPRRIFVPKSLEKNFTASLLSHLENEPPCTVTEQTLTKAQSLIQSAQTAGAKILTRPAADFSSDAFPPTILTDVPPDSPLAQADIFAPLASIIPVQSTAQAIEFNTHCPYALSATLFTGGKTDPETETLISALRVGSVIIDDIIIPTADPRVPFGGTAQSGYGETRGHEGLHQLTRPRIIMRRHNNWLPHLDPPSKNDAEILLNYLKTTHAPTLKSRLSSLLQLIKSARKK